MADEETYRLGDEGDSADAGEPRTDAGEYQGFDLRSVSWGYRRIFARAIEALLADGSVGPGRQEVTTTFFDMLKRAEPGSFDFVLKEFLGSLNRRTKWLLELPGVFEEFCRLGCSLAEEKLAHGISFFRLWGQGGFGQRPEHIRGLLTHVRALREVDAELAQAFLAGYGRLLEYLNTEEINLFVAELRRLHGRNPRAAADFAALRTKSALLYVRNLTQEARLDDLRDRLGRLARAVCGRGLNIGDLSELDSDPLIERNTHLVCLPDSLYLPARIRVCDDRLRNEALYLLTAVTSGEALRAESFPQMHGPPGPVNVTDWLGGDPVRAALLTLIEIVRVIDRLRRAAPGLRRLLSFAVDLEFDLAPPRTATDRLVQRCLCGDGDDLAAAVRGVAARSQSCTETRERMEPLAQRFGRAFDASVRSLLFFPDFYFPAERDSLPASAFVADLRSQEQRPDGQKPPPKGRSEAQEQPGAEEGQAEVVRAAFVYPEWNHLENDYYENWCLLHERTPSLDPHFRMAMDEADEAAIRRARRMFERLKPDLARKEKFLAHGDEIDIDRLVEYMALRRRLPSPRVRFYEKTFIKKRDLAAAVLLDVSGSTAGPPGSKADLHTPSTGQKRIIDLEKHAAMTLGEGLEALGDAFGIYGFSGNGREQCEFFIYKDLAEPFSPEARRRLMAAHPRASTRIGVALRHCHAKLQGYPARRKVIILITDGKPQDTGYDPTTRYAQYDVRMACHECRKHDIHVVCISTLANPRSDLEIMFPHRRYVILEEMTQLAAVLPVLYLKMTT